MPWDQTELWTARLDLSGDLPRAVDQQRLCGGSDVAIFQPEFTPDGQHVAYVSDETGWGQIYLMPVEGGSARRLTDGSGDYGRPAWAQGQRAFAFVDGGRSIVAIRSERGFQRLQRIDLGSGAVHDIEGDAAAYTAFDMPAGGDGQAAVIASSSVQPTRVISVDAASG